MQNVFFVESLLKQSSEKFNARDYRRTDAYKYRKTII